MNCVEFSGESNVVPLGTHVTLSAESPAWLPEGFLLGMVMFFRHPERIRVKELTFNGQPITHNGWKAAEAEKRDTFNPWSDAEIPALKPITVRPVLPNIPEWKKRA